MDERTSRTLRRAASALAAGAAAVLLARLPLELLTMPGLAVADPQQQQLSEWSAQLAPALARVPSETVLGFLPPGGFREPFGADEPSSEPARHDFELVQAVLAPRRLIPTPEADFVLAHVEALVLLSKTPGFQSLDGLQPVAPEWVLVERRAR